MADLAPLESSAKDNHQSSGMCFSTIWNNENNVNISITIISKYIFKPSYSKSLHIHTIHAINVNVCKNEKC